MFFRKTDIAEPIFNLDGGFQLFWSGFDLLVTVVPLKVALGWEKLIFGHLKIIMDIHLTTICMIISMFNLDGGFQLFWAAFDLPMTVVPLKVALGLEKIDFWSFEKNNKKTHLVTLL